jgi:hypothetical protein
MHERAADLGCGDVAAKLAAREAAWRASSDIKEFGERGSTPRPIRKSSRPC